MDDSCVIQVMDGNLELAMIVRSSFHVTGKLFEIWRELQATS